MEKFVPVTEISMGFSFWNQSFQEWWPQGLLMFQLLAAVWVIFAINNLGLGGRLNRCGLRPRRWEGLFGILYMPFLHSSWSHLWANSLVYVVFAAFILAFNPGDFLVVTIAIMLMSGLGVWLFARPNTIHVGASGVIFGYMGFCVALAYVVKNPVTAIIFIATIFFYANRIWLLFPIRKGMSWEGHLFGFASGIITALYLPLFREYYRQLLPFLSQLGYVPPL
jgi:membrane associated rhomboid family serine protease